MTLSTILQIIPTAYIQTNCHCLFCAIKYHMKTDDRKKSGREAMRILKGTTESTNSSFTKTRRGAPIIPPVSITRERVPSIYSDFVTRRLDLMGSAVTPNKI